MKKIEIPELCVVALIGASGSGKSTFASKYFKDTEVLSSDFFRGLICDDENSLEVNSAAFDSLYYVAEKRLEISKLAVIDATNVQQSARAKIVSLAKKHDIFSVAIVLNTPEKVCIERSRNRTDRNIGEHIIKRHCTDLKKSLRHLKKEGFRYIHVIDDADAEIEIVRTPSWTSLKEEHGPFDIIGDVHGCYDELSELLGNLGYADGIHPDGRKVIFLGDLCDRGNKITETLKLAMSMTKSGNALCVPGNHEAKLLKWLDGKNVQTTHGLQESVNQIESETPEFRAELREWLDTLISHYVLDSGRLVVAHAGMKERYQGRSSGRVREFALYGDTTGESDEYGLPVRLDWAAEYRGKATVVYGHTPTVEVYSANNTHNIDTGCVFGGKLTAYRYPEGEIASVPAKYEYCESAKPLKAPIEDCGDVLNVADVLEKRAVATELFSNITIREENAAAAIEIMSRFAADPHWLIYLPPTMSPCETSAIENMLEHPAEAFEYFRKRGVEKVVCEQKHMGSRAVVIVCRDADSARRRFGVNDGSAGIIYTRTGRAFFDDVELQNCLTGFARHSRSPAFGVSSALIGSALIPS
jgi:protein phosphatase